MGKQSAPPPPDYAAAAKETAAGNLQAAKQATEANRANQVNPYGSLTWTQDPAGKWTQTTALSDTGQQLFDQSNKTSLGLASLQDAATGRVGNAFNAGWGDQALAAGGTPLGQGPAPTAAPTQPPQSYGSPSAAPTPTAAPKTYMDSFIDAQANPGSDRHAGFAPGMGGTSGSDNIILSGGGSAPVVFGDQAKYDANVAANAANGIVAQQPATAGQAGTAGGSPTAQALRAATAPTTGGGGPSYDPNQATNAATQSILARVNPQLDRRRQAAQSLLANQGITQGSEAWNNAQTDLGQSENDAYIQAGLAGINTGMAQQGQTFGQNLQNSQFGLGAQQQGFNQGMQYQGTAFNQAQAARAAGLTEQNYFANRDLNQLNAIRSGSQVTNPTFGSYAQQQTTSGPDMLNAANMGYNAQLGSTNASNAGSSSTMNGVVGLASAAAMAF